MALWNNTSKPVPSISIQSNLQKMDTYAADASPALLVHVSIFQGSFWVLMFDPHPPMVSESKFRTKDQLHASANPGCHERVRWSGDELRSKGGFPPRRRRRTRHERGRTKSARGERLPARLGKSGKDSELGPRQ